MSFRVLIGKVSKHRYLLALNIALILFLYVMLWIKPVDALRKYNIYNHNGDSEDSISVYGDISVAQTFTCMAEADSFDVYISVANDLYRGTYNVYLYDENGTVIQSWMTDKLDTAYGWMQYKINGSVLEPRHDYKIVITAPELDEENAILVFVGNDSEKVSGVGDFEYYSETDSYENLQNGYTLCFGVYKKMLNIFAIFAVFVLFAGVNISYCFRDKGIYWFSVPVLVTTGLIMLLIMAPGSGPDDKYHYYSAFKLSNILMGRDNVYEVENKYRSDLPIHYNKNSSFVDEYEGLRYNIKGEEGTFVYEGGIDKLKQPLSHLAQAAGITVGRILRLSFIRTYTLGRLFNLFFYIALVWLAIHIVPVNKELMLMIGIVPMSMHQAAQLSYDAPVNGLTMIFISYIFKLMYEKEQITWKKTVIITVMLTLIAPLKVIYIILGLLLMLMSNDQYKTSWDRIIKTLIPLGTSVIVLILSRSSDVTRAVNHVSRSNNYNIGFALSQPMRFIKLILFNTDEYFWVMIKELLGGSLSGFSVPIPEYLIMLFLAMLLLCAIASDENFVEKKSGTLILIIIGILGFLAMITVFAFSETQYGSIYIGGIQGRYLIPFFPVVLYSMCRKMVTADRRKLFIPIAFVEIGYIVSVMNNIAF